jgi:eukaryotic-like serine/threonine-protein kinase
MAQTPTSDWTWINALADRFEHAWKQGPRPRIEDYLAEVDEPRRVPLLNELLRVELELRRRAGDEPAVAEYVARFPEHVALIKAVFGPGPGRPTPSVPGHELPTIAPGATAGQNGSNGEPGLGRRVRYFGDYEITREIARGGMGVVFQATQISLNRPVALKMILAGLLADEIDVKRFRTEAEAAANLDHPGIVPIYEIGQHEGQHYFSMGLNSGESLAQRLGVGLLPARDAASLLLKVTDAIAYAHRHGVIHRDLKPSNILIDADGNPRVTDFGLAKRVHADSGLTGSGQIMGTPSYMPPEQAGGKRGEVGPAADVYALGATLYAMIAGRPPFQAATAMDTVLQVLSDEPVPPRRLNAAIARDLETICLKCLEKEPSKRYRDAAALREDLRRFQSGEPILARPVTRLERVVKWARRRPAIAALLSSVGLVTALGLGGVLWHWREAVLARRVAGRESMRAKAQAELAERESERAKAQTKLAEQRLYDVQMIFAQRNWEDYHGNLLLLALEEQLPANQGGVDRRGFEWFYWRRKTLSDQITLKGHPDDPFMRAAFSRDAGRLIGGGRDGAVKVWNATTGREILRLKGHNSQIACVAFSPDGQRVASAAEKLDMPGEVKVWDATTGQEICTLTAATKSVTKLAFSHDGQRLASAGFQRGLKVWDLATRKAVDIFPSGSPIAFSSDGHRFAVDTGSLEIKVCDAATGRQISTCKRRPTNTSCLEFSPNGQYLASAHLDRVVKIWDAASGQEIRTLVGRKFPFTSLIFSPDGLCLASGYSDGGVQVWDALTGQEIGTLKGATSSVSSLVFSADGRRLHSAGGNGRVKAWDVTGAQETLTMQSPTQIGGSVAFDQFDNVELACGGRDGTVTLWHVAAGQETRAFKGHTDDVRSVAFGPDGHYLASASRDETVKLWNAATGLVIHTFKGHTKPVASVAFSPDGLRLASAGADLTVRVWDIATGQEIHTLRARSIQVTNVAFSPDSKRLAASESGTLEVWDVATGQEMRTIKAHAGLLLNLAFSPDGQLLASAASDGTVKVWDTATGKSLQTLRGHTNYVTCVTFSPDGRRIATGGDDAVKLWDAATGQQTVTLEEQSSEVQRLAFSRDGDRLAASHIDGTIKVWDARPLEEDLATPGPGPR